MRYIGNDLNERMDLLGIDEITLSDLTFLDVDYIKRILNNEVSFEEIEEFDISLLSDALHCDPHYFVDEEIKRSDLLIATMNRGKDTVKSKNVKAKIQDFLNDFAFVNDIIMEES